MRQIILIIHNVRSAHNVGSLLRTADGLGIEKVIISGISPYPAATADQRLPHIAAKTGRAIAKTSLGAESYTDWQHTDDLAAALDIYKQKGFEIIALEQTPAAVNIREYNPPNKVVLVVGNEISGIDKHALDLADKHLIIPMLGQKESFNVAVAGAMALYQLRSA